jgi:hypothetical protein
MKLTNQFNLPAPLVKAVENDKYTAGNSDYTTTQLAGTPARQLVLRRLHWNDLTEDVADRIYSLSGQSKHVVLERAAEFCDEYEFLAEQRFYIQREGKTIGGQIDLYDKVQRILYDWKEVSVWVSKNDMKHEWIAQANINRLLMEENGNPVDKVTNIALYRDWRKAQAETTKDYPQHQVEPFDIPLWSRNDTETFITKRIFEFEQAKVNLPECTDDERWYSGDKFALMKKGGKRAVKLFDTEQAAREHQEIFDLTSNHEIQYREGINKRCASYCNVANVCEWWQAHKPKEQSDGTE